MDYRHFQRLVQSKGSTEKSDLLLLSEFVRDYPYCQTAQLLLTRSMYLQDHVRYEEQLRRSAIAVPDRTALFNLIHVETNSPLRIDGTDSPFRDSGIEIPVPISTAEEDTARPFFQDDKTPSEAGDIHSTAEGSVDVTYWAPEESVELPPSVPGDPHDVVRQRLESLLQPIAEAAMKREPEPAASDSAPVTRVEAVSESSASPSENPPPATMDAEPLLKELELSHAYEENILQALEALPELPPMPVEVQPVKPEGPTVMQEPSSSHPPVTDFYAWLRENQKSSRFGQVEEISADSEPDPEPLVTKAWGSEPAATIPGPDQQVLINQFIETSPRIIPQPKAEFFNPSVQAKRSVEEHEDLVSETLAKIYADQGITDKAISAYRRLALLHPEKSAYFATLIKTLEGSSPSNSEPN